VISGSADGERGSMTMVAILGVIVLICSYTVNAMDRSLFPLLLTNVRHEYAFSLPQAGLLSTIFTLGLAIAGLPTGYLMSRLSRKAVIQVGLFIFSAATLVTVASVGFGDMLFYRAVSGVGEAMQLTALIAIFSNYFLRYRATAIGILNYAFSMGAIIAPISGTRLLVSYESWRAPMIIFGLIGFVMMVLVAVFVRPSLSEANATQQPSGRTSIGGATTLRNINTIVLVILSVIMGLSLFAYFSLYPTFLREHLHYTPIATGRVMSIYGAGVLVSAGGGWLGDRFSPRLVTSLSFLVAAVAAFLMFNGPEGFAVQATLSFVLGAAISGSIYVNLAAYHVMSVTSALSARASGIFVTSFFAAATVAGYLNGWLVSVAGWVVGGDLQMALLCFIGAIIALALQPALMSKPAA
jgi:MFS family permease